jgi:hypothetical protein
MPISLKRYVLLFAILVAALSLFPFLKNLAATPQGNWYVGTQFNTDDQMVYTDWMSQAEEGRLFMDNRFAVDEQPSLTVNCYFFALGQISRFIGPEWTLALSRALFGGLLVWMLALLLWKLRPESGFVKLGLFVTVFGTGLGFTAWHSFGNAVVVDSSEGMGRILYGGLPTDVWQPEGFVFPSMLVNGLFVFSLCLILAAFHFFIDAKDNPKAVLPGAAVMLLLMNTHSYDVLLIALVMIAFVVAGRVTRILTRTWLVRGFLIFLGAVPAALWFLYVLREDPVFQARAATLTFSPNFRQVFFGYLPLIFLGLAALAPQKDAPNALRSRNALGVALLALLIAAGFSFASPHADAFWMGIGAWIVVFVAVSAAAALMARGEPIFDLMVCWAAVGLIALYFPGLFQRKLAIGLSIPWGILASLALWTFATSRAARERWLLAGAALLIFTANTALWIAREAEYARLNVSRTTQHPVYFESEVRRLLSELRKQPGRKVVLAMPGIASHIGLDLFGTPIMPDLNPLAAAYGLAYAYAGHWSETPEYLTRRARSTRFFLDQTPADFRDQLIRTAGVTHIVAPNPKAFHQLEIDPETRLADLTKMGKVLFAGQSFSLIELPKS